MLRRRPTRRNVWIHLTAAVVVPGCIALCWWQVTRALGGNSLSWAYVFEWPIFAGYGIYMWWKLIHDPPASEPSDPENGQRGALTSADVSGGDPGGGSAARAGSEAGGDEEDEELASYNRYLAALNASGKKKQW